MYLCQCRTWPLLWRYTLKDLHGPREVSTRTTKLRSAALAPGSASPTDVELSVILRTASGSLGLPTVNTAWTIRRAHRSGVSALALVQGSVRWTRGSGRARR